MTDAEKPELTEKQKTAVLRLAAELNKLGVSPVSFLREAVDAESEAKPLLHPNEEKRDLEGALATLLKVRPVPFEQVDLLRAPSVLEALEQARSRAWGDPKARTFLARVSKSIAGEHPRGKPRSYPKYAEALMQYALFLSVWDEILKGIGRPPRARRGRDARLPKLGLSARIRAQVALQVEEHKNASDLRRLKKNVNATDLRHLKIDAQESFEMLRPGSRSRRVHTPIGLPVPKARAAMAFLGDRVDDYDDALAEVEKLRKIASRPWKRSS
jgi:hypothetical protein